MQNQRRPARSATEAKAPRRDLDINKERLIFCLASLTGHKVTAKLRGNVIYQGLFHGCALEGDFSITLKHARSLPTEHAKSGPVIDTLVIPGKDFLQVNAMDVPSPELLEGESSHIQSGAFQTDADIAAKLGNAGEEGGRDLVPWAAADGEEDSGGLEDYPPARGHSGRGGAWDANAMFEVNEKRYGVTTTFNEDLYTTKLDPSTIPLEKRKEAERIAREIESSAQCSDGEDKGNDGDDEEGRFSAVAGTGAYRRKNPQASSLTGSSGAASSKARGPAPAQGPASDALALAQGAGLQLPASQAQMSDYRKQRGMITAQSPMHSSMISEMKRINALNLEPAVPKLDDKTGTDWVNFKASQSRNRENKAQGEGLKAEFEQALAVIRKRESQKQKPQTSQDQAQPSGQIEAAGSASPSGGDSKPFKFNANAKDFTFNPTAATFTPTGAAASTPASASQAESASKQAKQSGAVSTGPEFTINASKPELARLQLEKILDRFSQSSCGARGLSQEPKWSDANGPSFREILGQPNPMMPIGQLGNGASPGQWQQQQPGMGQMGPPGAQAPGQPPAAQQMMPQQGQMGGPGGQPTGQPNAPQMMGQQGFVMGAAPGGQSGQMFQPMYPAPTGAAPMPRPAGGAGQMPVQGQQPMVFNQQGMMQQGQGQQMAMPGNMAQMQGQQMVMMMPAGQGMPQGFAPMPGQPGQPGQAGQPGQQGGHPGAPQQMMPRPMYHGQMGGGGPPHQMQG